MGFKYRSDIDYALMQRASTKLQQNGETLIGQGVMFSENIEGYRIIYVAKFFKIIPRSSVKERHADVLKILILTFLQHSCACESQMI